MKQRTIRVFEVDDFENLKSIIKTKYPLIKNHFFMLKEKNPEIEDLLKRNNLNYFILNDDGFISNKEVKEKVKIIEKKVVVNESKSVIFDKIIRSGEEINLNSHAVFLNRINPGAKIVTKAPIELFEENDGLVIADGEYIIVKKNINGTIIFKGIELGKVDKLTFFGENFKKVLE